MKAVRAPTAAIHLGTASATNSGPVVGPDIGRDAAQDEQIRQDIDDVGRRRLAPDPDCQALPGELVQEVERAKGPPVMGPMMHEVIEPNTVPPARRAAGHRNRRSAQTSPLRLLSGHLQPLAPPQALDLLVVDLPAGVVQQGRDPPVSVTTVPVGELDYVRDQATLVVRATGIPTLHWRRREGPSPLYSVRRGKAPSLTRSSICGPSPGSSRLTPTPATTASMRPEDRRGLSTRQRVGRIPGGSSSGSPTSRPASDAARTRRRSRRSRWRR